MGFKGTAGWRRVPRRLPGECCKNFSARATTLGALVRSARITRSTMMHFKPTPNLEPFFAGSEGDFHKTLARFNQERFTPANPGIVLFEPGNTLRFERMEVAFVEAMRQEARAYLAAMPAEPTDLPAWFATLAEKARAPDAALLAWLAEHADREQMRWVLQQGVGAESSTADLLALIQIRMPARVKAIIARAFWEEMGCGEEKAQHSEMLERLTRHFGIRADVSAILPEALAQENVLNAMAAHRQYAFHAVGALGIAALMNETRAQAYARGLVRLKVPAKARKYFTAQAAHDDTAMSAWMSEVIVPLAQQNATRAQSIAEGAVIRVIAAARCHEAFRLKFASELRTR
jgi:hypothetical protein